MNKIVAMVLVSEKQISSGFKMEGYLIFNLKIKEKQVEIHGATRIFLELEDHSAQTVIADRSKNLGFVSNVDCITFLDSLSKFSRNKRLINIVEYYEKETDAAKTS